MNELKLLFNDFCFTYNQMSFVAGELLSSTQIKTILETTLLEYNIKNTNNYENIDEKIKEKMINYTNDLFNHELLTSQPSAFQLSFNNCCVLYAIYHLYNHETKYFSINSLILYIQKLYNINNFFFDINYMNSTNDTIKRFGKITSFSNNIKHTERKNIFYYPYLFFINEISIITKNQITKKYKIIKSPDFKIYEKDINLFSILMEVPNIF